MKSCLALILMLFVLTAAASAQTAAPPPAAEKWQTFAPLDEEFAVEAPADFRHHLTKPPKENLDAGRGYHCFFGGNYYYIFSDSLTDPYFAKIVLGYIGQNKSLSSQDGRFEFTDGDGFIHQVLIVRTGRRIYTFQIVSQKKDDPETRRFFANLKINGISPKAAETFVRPQPPETVSSTDLAAPANTAAAAAATVESKPSSGPVANSNSPAATPLALRKTTAAPYTDWARFYQIEGGVRVRVTFGADGKIAKVAAVNKLPFGLVGTALNAARQIEFTPATVNGQPVSAVKVIQYEFTIY